MRRAVAFIDGFNLYYSLQKSDNNQYHKYKWLDLRKLMQKYVYPETELLGEIFYFTALPKNEEKRKRHIKYIKALRNSAVKDVKGKIKFNSVICSNPKCGKEVFYPIEKQTDANIITRVLSMTMCDDFDVALVVSADSDLVPMIKAAKAFNPSKVFRLVIPIHQKAKELTEACDERRKIKADQLEKSQFPESIELETGEIISRPENWN